MRKLHTLEAGYARGQHPNSADALMRAVKSRPKTKERVVTSMEIALKNLIDERLGEGHRSVFVNEAIRFALSNPDVFRQVKAAALDN